MPIPLPNDMLDTVHDLTLACLSGEASPEEVAELNELLRNDKTARRIYAYAILDSSRLRRWAAATSLHSAETFDGESETIFEADGTFLPLLDNAIHGPVGYFSSDCPVAYLVATVILGIGLLIGAFVQVSVPTQIAQQSTLPSPLSPTHSIVGRITGMTDCQWESSIHPSSFLPHPSSPVSLGDKFALSSGLMEITYDTGAKVILQGPVTYEVESAAGGFLSVGKLTARLEKKEERRTKNEELSGSNSSFLIPRSYFAVRTPTATVTDLGTEFGVEVSSDGATMSHVFRGLVEVQVVGDGGKPEGTSQVLRENESVRVDLGQGERKIAIVSDSKSARFVRDIPKRTMKVFDLVDVVAGGDGFSGRRGRGIDPASGQPTNNTLAEPSNANTEDLSRFRVVTDRQYHRAETFPFVDGVFIPDGRPGGVPVDSAGHVFSEFSTNCNATAGNIWAGGVISVLSSSMPPNVAALLTPLPPSETLLPTTLGDIDYASEAHGLILLPSNLGITFDLDAIRRANPNCRLLRFRAAAGNTEIASENGLAEAYGDISVLVDGQMRFRRRQINKYSGVFQIALPIAEKDRFLTLVATDGGNDIGFDWMLFGDPVLEMLQAVPARQTNPPPK